MLCVHPNYLKIHLTVFMTKSLAKFLSFILIKTFLIASVVTILTSTIINSIQSRGMEAKQADFIGTVATLFWILALTLSALTVYLNLKKSIRDTPLFSFLSFFLLPTLAVIAVFISGDRNAKWILFYISTVIFLLTQTFFYILFVRQNRIGWTIAET